MISILVVDDNQSRVERIKAIIGDNFIGTEIDIHYVDNQFQAKNHLALRQYDLLVLDLNVPPMADELPEENGGLTILREAASTDYMKMPIHVLAITSYPALKVSFDRKFSDQEWSAIEYKPGEVNWEQKLESRIRHIAKTKFDSTSHYRCDIGVITALRVPEFEAVLAISDDWKVDEPEDDDSSYHRSVIRRGSKSMTVVATTPDRMGLTATAVAAMKLVNRYRPKYLVMTGIAAGVKGRADFGDILVPELLWDHGAGKIRANSNGEAEFVYETNQVKIDERLRDRVGRYKLDDESLFKIWKSAGRDRSTLIPKVVVGPMASGAAVIQYSSEVERVQIVNRKLIGLDMEAYAVFYAAENSPKPKPLPLVIKSVCDFADSEKNDNYQAYAAHTSAQFMVEFALSHL